MACGVQGVAGSVWLQHCGLAAQEQASVPSLSADGAVSQPQALQGQSKGSDLCVQRG